MKLKMSDLERRALCIQLVNGLTAVSPSPWDLAAIAVELAEMATESIAHCCDVRPELGQELQAELGRVRTIARESSELTTAMRVTKTNARSAGATS